MVAQSTSRMRVFPTLLTTLLDFVLPPSADALLVRTATADSLRTHYAPHDAYGATALLPFRDPLVRALIHEAKFRRNSRATQLLAELLARHLATTHPIRAACTLIPIPLSHERHRERGYNQVALLAQAAMRYAPNLNVRDDLLTRVRHTPPQTTLSRTERLANLTGAFVAQSQELPTDTTLILLDDVTTTGATLASAAAALRAAGFTHIEPLALAH